MLEALKIKVWDANKKIADDKFGYGLVSAIDRESGLVVVCPDGVDINKLEYEDMLVTDFEGNVIEGEGDVPSDTLTHLEIYGAFEEIDSIASSQTLYATAFAQAGRDIPVYGAFHAKNFYGDIPCVSFPFDMTGGLERNVGSQVCQQLSTYNLLSMPACLIGYVGLLSFGKTTDDAIKNALCAERVASLAYLSETLCPEVAPAPDSLREAKFAKRKR